MRLHRLLLLPLLLLPLLCHGQPLNASSKICKTIHISTGNFRKHRNLARLREEWIASVGGCEYVYGDVIIKNVNADPVTEEPYDQAIRSMNTDFLDSIVEIRGRLAIKRVNLEVLALRNLRTIRGYNLENVNQFVAAEIMQSKYPTQLRLPKLSAIQRGNVRILSTLHASMYCHLSRTIEWSSILHSPLQRFIDDVVQITLADAVIKSSDKSKVEKACASVAKCSTDCSVDNKGQRLCWANGAEGCQSYNECQTRKCAKCFRNHRTKNEECCDAQCLGGCVSGHPSGCFSCLQVSREGSCAVACPKPSHNGNTGRVETLKGSLWQIGNICVKKCEMPFMSSSDGQYCLAECKQTEVPLNGVCTSCASQHQSSCDTCPLTVIVISDTQAHALKNGNCAIWRTDSSLDFNVAHLKDKASLGALEFLQIFYGRLYIKRSSKLVPDLRYLRNLKFVSDNFAIMFTKAHYLGLAKLTYAKSMLLYKIDGLCKAWYPAKRIQELKKTFPISERTLTFDNTSQVCRSVVCDPQCLDECWGPGPDLCVACRNFQVDGRCYASREAVGE